MRDDRSQGTYVSRSPTPLWLENALAADSQFREQITSSLPALFDGRDMLYKLGRFLQVIGLILPIVGIAGNMASPEQYTLKYSLTMAAIGIGIFYLGRFVQGRGSAPGP
jgi:hypothetical protein